MEFLIGLGFVLGSLALWAGALISSFTVFAGIVSGGDDAIGFIIALIFLFIAAAFWYSLWFFGWWI